MVRDLAGTPVVGKYARAVTIAASGPQGAAGPTGPTGPRGLPGSNGVSNSEVVALVSYRHLQNSVSDTWTVVHNLNFFPNVTVFDSGESQIEGSVTHIDETQLTITFSAAISGKAHLS